MNMQQMSIDIKHICISLTIYKVEIDNYIEMVKSIHFKHKCSDAWSKQNTLLYISTILETALYSANNLFKYLVS